MNVLLTRPLAQVKPLQSLVSGVGYQPLLFPSLEIQTLKTEPQKNHYDVMIFISVNAVEQGLHILKRLNHQACKILAVGASTANKLQDYGFEVAGFPVNKASSEALLAMPMVKQLCQQTILIFRGRGGRETLKEGLAARNSVEYIEVYERTECDVTPSHQAALTQFLHDSHGIVTITSIENLSSMLLMFEAINPDAVQLIKAYPLVVLSERIKTYAGSIGFNWVEVAPQTSDVGLVEAIKRVVKT